MSEGDVSHTFTKLFIHKKVKQFIARRFIGNLEIPSSDSKEILVLSLDQLIY